LFQCAAFIQTLYYILYAVKLYYSVVICAYARECKEEVRLLYPPSCVMIICFQPLCKLTVKLGSFGEWYWKLSDEVKEPQEDTFGGISFKDEEWLLVMVSKGLVDEVNTTCPGFCFGDLERNGIKKYEDAGLRVIFSHPYLKDQFSSMHSGSRFIINAVGCHEPALNVALANSVQTSTVTVCTPLLYKEYGVRDFLYWQCCVTPPCSYPCYSYASAFWIKPSCWWGYFT
jgi:hypothetical protein